MVTDNIIRNAKTIWRNTSRRSNHNDIICNQVVPLQRQLAEDLDCYLLDLNNEFEQYTDDQLFRPNDGVHLTKFAAEVTASLLAEKIKSIYGI